MPTININAIGNILLGGFAAIVAVVWLFVHLSAVRDLHEGGPVNYSPRCFRPSLMRPELESEAAYGKALGIERAARGN